MRILGETGLSPKSSDKEVKELVALVVKPQVKHKVCNTISFLTVGIVA